MQTKPEVEEAKLWVVEPVPLTVALLSRSCHQTTFLVVLIFIRYQIVRGRTLFYSS
jgi:hypothetical protein